MKGATSIMIFTETLTATRYAKILDKALFPFLRTHFPHRRRHRLQQDNDPKHTSNFIKQYFKDHRVKLVENFSREPRPQSNGEGLGITKDLFLKCPFSEARKQERCWNEKGN